MALGLLDLELGADQIVDEVDHRAPQKDQRQLVDQHRGAVALDAQVVSVRPSTRSNLYWKAGAAAAFDGDARQRRLAGLATIAAMRLARQRSVSVMTVRVSLLYGLALPWPVTYEFAFRSTV